jgi:hypothetical protein
MHQEVLALLDSQGRTPASPAGDVGAKLVDLAKLRPGKFEVYVFPKLTNQTNKAMDADDSYLGKPQAFEVSVVAENPCKQFIQRGLFGNLRPADAFPTALANGDRRCAIIEVTDKRLRTINRALLRANDVLMTRLFVDDTYHVHATDRVIHLNAGTVRTIRALGTENSAGFSGLSLFPIDLPPQTAQFAAGKPADSFRTQLDGVTLYQIRRHHSRAFTTSQCSGGVMSYRDDYGANTRIGWCQGLPWPSFIENSRFVSVSQPLSVGGAR